MGVKAQQAAAMIDLLPENDQNLVFSLIQRLVTAWDPDYTKVTPFEAERIAQAEKDMLNGDYVTGDQIDWGFDTSSI